MEICLTIKKQTVMQKLVMIIVLFISSLVTAQGNYEKGMAKAFDLWENNKTTEAANLFERIATAESENWLPAYYAAYVNVIYSFGEKDKELLTAKLKKAQDLINDASSISPRNPEIMILQALLHTAWIAYDGATYGMTLSGKVMTLYNEAESISPNNPRVILNKAEWNMGSARFFGQDTKPFCKDVERSLELFANFKPESEFHPNWGKERAEQIISDCK